ncbi:putative phage-associated acyl carrier protein [Yersinia thracica]|uniref:Putative phage-associated acyl carrier protein n=1 Tax=Yersinia thracica TaxID=2890319 RepID=A0A0T9QD02_9GAMM|nr:DUF1493 family protein [Yersinia thracica]CNI04334.1 putative phage-associated acyl carrier protein [Yersinia thracica]
MVTDQEILDFFRHELPLMTTLTLKPIPIEMDTILQAYAEEDDLYYAVEKYNKLFGVDISNLDMNNYYPWDIQWFFRKWFTKTPIKQTKKPLTVQMFSESAKAGRWLYD